MSTAFERLLLGKASDFQAVLRTAQIIASTDVTTLILGESGTGKELLARAMHLESQRAERTFLPVNCASIPQELAESALFGHRKGAFTGADSHHAGFVGNAEGGTLLLDEIGELPLGVQAKLLRFLETGEYHPLGEATPVRADVRIIAATNRDLQAQVKAGHFRTDLYYRLNIVPVELPPLRQRHGDIPLLLEQLSTQLAAQHQLSAPHYSREAIKQLKRHHWPGNVRELRNLCERMVILFHGRTVETGNLPAEIRHDRDNTQHEGTKAQSKSFILPERGLKLEDVEIDLIRQALDKTAGNRSRAARLLGLTRDTLLYRMKKYALT